MNINLTLLGQMITFVLFALFVQRFVCPPLVRALKDRQAKIAAGLAAAEKGHIEFAQAQDEATKLIKVSKDEAANIVLDGRKQADAIVDAARQQAHVDAQRIIQQGHAEVERMIDDAKEQLRKQVAALAMVGAEKILSQAVDTKAHASMLDKLAEEI